MNKYVCVYHNIKQIFLKLSQLNEFLLGLKSGIFVYLSPNI